MQLRKHGGGTVRTLYNNCEYTLYTKNGHYISVKKTYLLYEKLLHKCMLIFLCFNRL